MGCKVADPIVAEAIECDIDRSWRVLFGTDPPRDRDCNVM